MDWKVEYRNALLDISSNPPDIREIVKPHIPDILYKYGNFENQYWEKLSIRLNFIFHLRKYLMILLIAEQILTIKELLVKVNFEMN